MSDAPFRVVVFGLGHAGTRLHLPALARLSGVQVVGAYDPDPVRRAEVSHVRTLADEGEALAVTADAVVIATPPDTHARLALAALAHGRHVYVEKPMAHTIEAARAVQQAGSAGGRTVQVGFAYRFHPLWQRLARLVRSGRLRPPFSATAVFDAAPGTGWAHPMLNVGVHHIDLLTTLAGVGPVEVTARTDRDLEVRWADGSILHGSYGDGPGRDRVVVTFGATVIDLDRRRSVRLRGAGWRATLPSPPLVRSRLGGGDWEQSFERAQRAFVDAARRNEPAVPGPEEGLRAVLVGEATARSLDTRQPTAVEG